MKIISRLKQLFGGGNKSKNISIDHNTNSNSQYQESEIEEKTLEELYPNMTEDEIWTSVIEKDENELTFEELFLKLGITLYHEHLYNRSLAIRELMNNSYQILNDEHGNPFKELINFTLQYFEKYFEDKPVKADILLRSVFPLMYQFIYRQISKQQNTISIEDNFDEQQAYDEFLDFCKNVFCSLYPDKNERDIRIRRHFKKMGGALISYIEEEEKEQ